MPDYHASNCSNQLLESAALLEDCLFYNLILFPCVIMVDKINMTYFKLNLLFVLLHLSLSQVFPDHCYDFTSD